MIDGTFRVARWTSELNPRAEGKARLWSCVIELRNRRGNVYVGLDLPFVEVERLNALIARGPVRLSEIFGVTDP